MFFWKKTPKRLYYPVKSNWYTRPRRKSSVKRSGGLFKGGLSGARHVLKKSIHLVVIAGLFVFVILVLAFSSYFSIKRIEVVRENFNVDSAAIENELNQFIGKNIIFFTRGSVYETIQKKFPEFSSVGIRKILPSTVKIELESHPIIANLKAYYILPEAEPPAEESFSELNKAIEEIAGSGSVLFTPEPSSPVNDKAVMDSAFTLDENKKEPEPVEQKCLLNSIGQAIFEQEENLELMTIVIRGLSQPIADRGQVMPKEHMDYILETIQYFKNTMGLEILGTEYLPVAREIHLKTKDNLVLWVSTERSYKEQIDKLNTIYKTAELNKEDLSYIDLRIKEKVIYCPRNSSCDK